MHRKRVEIVFCRNKRQGRTPLEVTYNPTGHAGTRKERTRVFWLFFFFFLQTTCMQGEEFHRRSPILLLGSPEQRRGKGKYCFFFANYMYVRGICKGKNSIEVHQSSNRVNAKGRGKEELYFSKRHGVQGEQFH